MTRHPRAFMVRSQKPPMDIASPLEPALARAKDRDELVTLFSGDVWRFASTLVRRREDAEDVVMEVFAAAFRDFDRVKSAANQRAWLLTVARKKAADSHRRHYRRAELPLTDAPPAPPTTPSALHLAAHEALGQLPDHQREVLTLKYVNGLSIEEIGRVMRRSTAATNSLLQRARQCLRESLGLADEESTGDKR